MLPIVRNRIRAAAARRRNLELIQRRIALRRQSRPFSLSEERFIELFRLRKHMVQNIIDILRPHLEERITQKGITLEARVLTALRFYATGSYQRCIGQGFNSGMSQSSVHRCIRSITSALVRIAPDYIKLPNTLEERNEIKQEFMDKWRFPGAVGAIDCTHIAILKPQVDEHNFINRKGFHSLNVQAVCDPSLKIRSIFANFGGSTHDSFIWRNSDVKDFMNALHVGQERSWLIGDSGYPLEPILLTPFRDPQNEGERGFNAAHMSARNCIERCFGVYKNRFRCLLKERSARYQPEFMCEVIKACAVLHNMCINENFHEEPEEIDGAEDGDDNVNNNPPCNPPNIQALAAGIQVRSRVVQQYF